jgi:hypothetical protein
MIYFTKERMDKDTRLALVDIVEVSQATMQSASEARILSLPIHDALLKACVPVIWKLTNPATTTWSVN